MEGLVEEDSQFMKLAKKLTAKRLQQKGGRSFRRPEGLFFVCFYSCLFLLLTTFGEASLFIRNA